MMPIRQRCYCYSEIVTDANGRTTRRTHTCPLHADREWPEAGQAALEQADRLARLEAMQSEWTKDYGRTGQ